jgi:hypothetical protein
LEKKKVPLDIRSQVLHEAAYQCSNPICRSLLTLDIHHIDKVSNGGNNSSENLIALCPNCHRRFHNEEIPIETIKSWKYHLLALNEAFNKDAINYLLLLYNVKSIFVRSEGLLKFAALIASGNILLEKCRHEESIEIDHFLNKAKPTLVNGYNVTLSPKGTMLIENWINGKQITSMTQ